MLFTAFHSRLGGCLGGTEPLFMNEDPRLTGSKWPVVVG